MGNKQCFIAIAVFICCFTCVNTNNKDVEQFKATKLKNYDKELRPDESGNVLEVGVEFSVENILNVKADVGLVTASVKYRLVWTDYRLIHSIGDMIKLKWSDVWLPDLHLHQSISTNSPELYQSRSLVNIYKNGTVLAQPSGSLDFPCSLDMRMYPFDHQECEMVLGSGSYDDSEIKLTSVSDQGSVRVDGKGSRRYEIESFKVIDNERKDKIHYKVKFKRMSGYYRFGVVIPLALIGLVLTPLMFLIPPHHPHKILPGISSFISSIILIVSIIFTLPSTGHTTPTLVVFAGTNLILSSFALLLEILPLWLISSPPHPPCPPPRWLLTLATNVSKCCCCFNSCKKWLEARPEDDSGANQALDLGGGAGKVTDNQKIRLQCLFISAIYDRFWLITYCVVFVVITGLIHAT